MNIWPMALGIGDFVLGASRNQNHDPRLPAHCLSACRMLRSIKAHTRQRLHACPAHPGVIPRPAILRSSSLFTLPPWRTRSRSLRVSPIMRLQGSTCRLVVWSWWEAVYGNAHHFQTPFPSYSLNSPTTPRMPASATLNNRNNDPDPYMNPPSICDSDPAHLWI